MALSVYKRVAEKFPFLIPSIQSGFLMGTGDFIAQKFIDKKSFQTIDRARLLRFSTVGFCIGGPGLRMWYGILDRYVKGKHIALKKVVVDQVVFAPFFLGLLLYVINLTSDMSAKEAYSKLKHDYPSILLNNYKVWPAIQLCNFYITPLQYQVLVVQSVAVFWNTYISWKSNLPQDLNDE